MRTLIVLLPLCLAAPALADTCKYVDAEGRVTYSNVPVAGANRVSCLGSPGPTPHSAPARSSDERKTETARTPLPQESARTELQARLAAEETKLAEAKRQLAEQEAVRSGDERNYQRVLDRLAPYQDAVTQLEKSVGALQQELTDSR
jgi:hypothetical protein